jgi:hypothetical protein
MKTKKILALLISGVFATTMASQAAVITMPSGLSHGDQYRIVFVTSTTIQATSSDISTYNAHVTAAAALNPDLAVIEGTVEQTTTWTAIGSTDSVNARDNTSTTGAGTGIGIYLLNDTAIATSYTDLWDGTIANLFNVDEQGDSGPYANSQVWTGTNGDGSTGNDPLGTATPEFGKTNLTGVNIWINRLSGSSWPNTDTYHLFAISGILTVPEPSSTALLGLGGLALMLRRKRS